MRRAILGGKFSQKGMRVSLFFISLLGLLVAGPIGFSMTTKTKNQVERYGLSSTRQYELFRKILTFERTWKKKQLAHLTVALLYEKSYELSVWIKEDFVQAIEAQSTIEGLPVRLLEIPVEEIKNLSNLFSQENIAFLYITPLKPATIKNQLKKILALCRQFKIATFTGEITYVDLGVAIGLGVVDQKPQVFINLQAAKEQGLEFSSQLLRMSLIK
ncbi:MAG: YfiR family protein [Candidatus Aminicenantes bacterium]|nr:YfiR family protein [Candidatus Aminicenantes bacterium]